jgi:predicted nucleic acid-binding Zn ribbon protein
VTENQDGVGGDRDPDEPGRANPPSSGVASGSASVSRSERSDLARRLLEQARADARARGAEQAQQRAAARRAQVRAENLRENGGPLDGGDPQLLGATMAALVRAHGWERDVAVARLGTNWAQIVGGDIAEHCSPVTLADGELVVAAASTAWATQLRLLQRQLLDRVRAELPGIEVRTLRVQGPTAPNWRRGPLRVTGSRGPRDTYG